MTIETKESDGNLYVKVRGSLDALTMPQLEETLMPKLSGIRKLILDFERLSYISSAGLRLLLKIQNVLEDEDSKMTIRNVNEIVSDVFEVTGFVDFLNIE